MLSVMLSESSTNTWMNRACLLHVAIQACMHCRLRGRRVPTDAALRPLQLRTLKNFSSSAAYSITYGLNFLSQISACPPHAAVRRQHRGQPR